MFKERELRVRVIDTPFNPDFDEKVIEVDESGTRPIYKVWLLLDGPDLPFVRQVTYHLHKSFSRPTRVVRRTARNADCRLVLRTWGVFTVTAKIELRDGSLYELEHKLGYDRMFTRPGTRFVEMEKRTSVRPRPRSIARPVAKSKRKRIDRR